MGKVAKWLGGIVMVVIALLILASYFPIIPYKHYYDSSSTGWIKTEACMAVEPGTWRYDELDCGSKAKMSYEVEFKTLSDWITVKQQDAISNKYRK